MSDRARQNPRIDSTHPRWTLEEGQAGGQERAPAENIAVAGHGDPPVQRPFAFSDCDAQSYRQSKHRKFHGYRQKAGLTAVNVFGGVDSKKYIIETTGTGVAVFDYDNDGWPDIFVVNGTTLEGFPFDEAPTNHLYHNNHDGTFAMSP